MEAKNNKWNAAKDIFAGTCAGTASILVCHPLDTTRVRLQTDHLKKFNGVVDVFSKTVREEGMKGLYKGMGPPLVSQGIQKATMFWAYGASYRYMKSHYYQNSNSLSLSTLYLCGAFAGFCNTLVACPIELVRNRLQVQYALPAGMKHEYSGPIDCFRKIFIRNGVKGLWKGLWPMILRDVPGVGAWYAAFEASKRWFTPPAKTAQDIGSLKLMCAGALGGIGYWIMAFPQDAVKSVIQTRKDDSKLGFFATGRKMVKEEGFKRLYRGFSLALTRGIPGASITFLTYSSVMKWINQHGY